MTSYRLLAPAFGLLAATILASGCGGDLGQAVQPTSASTPTKTRRPTFTPAAQVAQAAAEPVVTATLTPSPTVETPTSTPPPPPPTETPTVPPPPTLERTNTPTPEPTATPMLLTPTPPAIFQPDEPDSTKYDFKITQQGILSEEENGGKGPSGLHHIFITVVDTQENPLDDVVVQDIRSGVEAVSGDKGKGKAELVMYADTMVVKAVRDNSSGRTLTSEESHRLSLAEPELEDLVAPGYCESVETCEYSPYMWHFSYRIVFQRQW